MNILGFKCLLIREGCSKNTSQSSVIPIFKNDKLTLTLVTGLT